MLALIEGDCIFPNQILNCSFAEMVTLLVTGTGSGSEVIEIIKPNGEVKTCPQSNNYPRNVYGTAGGYSNNAKSVTICGGYDGSSYRTECYSLEEAKWKDAGTMATARYHHGASYITTGMVT